MVYKQRVEWPVILEWNVWSLAHSLWQQNFILKLLFWLAQNIIICIASPGTDIRLSEYIRILCTCCSPVFQKLLFKLHHTSHSCQNQPEESKLANVSPRLCQT